MPRKDWTLRIEDMLECAEKIERYVQGMDFEAFVADERTTDAVARNVQIIGEAARHIPPEAQARNPEISWPEIRGMRNVLVHDYPDIELGIVWETIQVSLPATVPLLRAMLERERTPDA